MTLQLFERLVVGPLQCNCYLVGDPSTRDAVVIDPGDQPDDILEAVARHRLRLVAAVATHAHLDHVLGAQAIRQRANVPFLLHADDLSLLAGLREDDSRARQLPEVDRSVADGDEIAAGSLRLGVLHTPGHSPGSISLLVPDEAVFSGDTLFAGAIGRTDLPGGDPVQELVSIRLRLLTLGDLPVYPGHGPNTSIDRERISNPLVAELSRLPLR